MTIVLSPTAMRSASGDLDRPATRNGGSRLASGDADGEAPERIDEANGSELSWSGQQRAVLVVEDEPTVRLLITEVLNDLNYLSIEAIDGPSGLEILRSNAPVDLLITDVGLPGGMDGRELAIAARAERPGIAILFITGYAETAVLGQGCLEENMMVLAKPFSIAALQSSIRELIA